MYILYHTHVLDELWKKTMDDPNCSCYSGISGFFFPRQCLFFFYLAARGIHCYAQAYSGCNSRAFSLQWPLIAEHSLQ